MRSTLPKQLLYGAFYTLVLAGIGYLLYLALIQPAPTCTDAIRNQGEADVDCGGSSPCISCEIKHLKPIDASGILLKSGDRGSVLVTLTNPNGGYGLDAMRYTVRLLGATGEMLSEFSRDTFLYPSEIRRVLDFNVAGAATAASVNVTTDFVQESWRPLALFPLPRISIRELSVEVKSGGMFSVVGIVRNENAFSLGALTLVGVERSLDGSIRAASKTLLQDVPAFSEQSFSILFPVTESVPPAELIEVFSEARR